MNSTNHAGIGLLVLRSFIGLRLIYGVVDNIFSWPQMLEFAEFLHQNNFPFPLFNAIISVYLQFISGVCLILGYKTKWAALAMTANFAVAIAGFHLAIGDTIEGMTPALAMFFSSLCLAFTGPGNLSIDYLRRK